MKCASISNSYEKDVANAFGISAMVIGKRVVSVLSPIAPGMLLEFIAVLSRISIFKKLEIVMVNIRQS